jgi:hypothetical protein
MTEERIEEHKHTVTETDEGTTETHTERVVEQDKGAGRPEDTTIEKETVIDEDD